MPPHTHCSVRVYSFHYNTFHCQAYTVVCAIVEPTIRERNSASRSKISVASRKLSLESSNGSIDHGFISLFKQMN